MCAEDTRWPMKLGSDSMAHTHIVQDVDTEASMMLQMPEVTP